jgi:hypothetical protein
MNHIITALAVLLLSQVAYGFGSSSIKGDHEHGFITTAALACDSEFEPLNRAVPCFEPKTLSNLGGGHAYKDPIGRYDNQYGVYTGFSAVESPDNLVIHFSGGPDWWHCDNADYLESEDYPISRVKATKKVLDCRTWAQRVMGEGFDDNTPWCSSITGAWASYRCEGVAAISRFMLNNNSQVDVDQPGGFSNTTGCSFNGAKGRTKCLVLQQFGYALHAIQDFYSHSNYADMNPSQYFSFNSPPGIGSVQTPSLWDMKITKASISLLPDIRLSTGCYPDNKCDQRATHAVLNKDRGKIDTYTGHISEIYADMSPRGTVVVDGVSNSQRAIDMAIRQTRAAWEDLQYLIIQKEGVERGTRIICAIASDNPNQCGLTKAQATQIMPQGTFDAKKASAHDWVIRAYKNEANGGDDTQLSKAGKAGVDDVGITLDGIRNCGTRIIDHHHVTVDKNPKLDVHDIRVAGASCSRIVKLLNKTYLAGTQAGAERGLEAPMQCISKDIESTPSWFDSRILCKNKDETIQVSFLPDCGNKIGECGY